MTRNKMPLYQLRFAKRQKNHLQESLKKDVVKEIPAAAEIPAEPAEVEEPMADYDADEPPMPKELEPVSTPITTPRPPLPIGARGTLAETL